MHTRTICAAVHAELRARRRRLAGPAAAGGAGADRVAGGAEPPLRQAGLPLRGRRTARPVCLLAGAGAAGRYVPAALADVVRAAPGSERHEAVLAEISAINAELLARRELR